MSGPNEYYDWLPEARQIAAQCWCDDETKHLVMEPALAEAVARRVAAWMQTGAQHARNEEYWRDRALKAEAAPIVPQGWTEDQIADACVAAEIPDSKFESVMIALRAMLAASPAPLTDADGVPVAHPTDGERDLAALCARLVRRLREVSPDDKLGATATDYLNQRRYLNPLRIKAMGPAPANGVEGKTNG